MKIKTAFVLTLVFSLIFHLLTYAQDGGTLAERYHSKKAQRLALRLTQNKNSDEEKLDALFKWVANHIKYDVKKFLKGNNRNMTTKQILRKRKGLCTAYTQLFAELCYHAGIEAIEIEGYTKNVFFDVDEKFYYSDHVWNAVKLNGEWKPVDMTWCSGGIAFTRQTIFHKTLQWITFGKVRRAKFKPHFVKHVTKDYYLTNPTLFSIDHLSQNPDLQLRPDKLSIESYERDSTPYFLNCSDTVLFNKIQEGKNANPAETFAVETFYSTNMHGQIVINGNSGNNFNIKNSYCKAESETTVALTNYNRLIKSKTFAEADLKTIEEIKEHCNTSIAHTVCHNGELEQQKKQRDANNALKNKIVNEEVARSIKYVNPIYKNFKQYRTKYKIITKKSRKYFKLINKRQSKLERGKSFEKAKPAKETNRKALTIKNEDDKAFDVYKQLCDSVELHSQELTQRIEAFNKICINNKTTTGIYSGQLAGSIFIMILVDELQLSYWDALDCIMKSTKKDYFLLKQQIDSTVYKDTAFYAKELPLHLKSVRSAYDKLYRAEKKQYAELVTIKKKSLENTFIENVYNKWLQEINKRHSDYTQAAEKQRENFKLLSKNYKKCAKGTKKEIKLLRTEKSFEKFMFRFRKRFISNHYRSRKSANNAIKRTAIQLSKASDKTKKQIEKENKQKTKAGN